MSFTDWQILGTPSFVGLDNYTGILADPVFRTAFRNTAYFVLLCAPALIVLALALAVLLNSRLRGTRIVRAIVYLPVVIMVTVIGVLWSWLFDGDYGLLNYYLGAVGIGPVDWLGSERWAMPAIVITTVWWTVGTNMVIYLAALQDIPAELYDAAAIDGAGRWHSFWRVTLPMLRHVNAFVVPFTVIGTWQVFGQVFVMTGGGPGRSTVVLTQYIYLTAFQSFSMGPAAAASVLLMLIMFVCTIFVVRAMRVQL